MTEIPRQYTWYGKDVEGISREDLIVAFKEASDHIEIQNGVIARYRRKLEEKSRY